MSTIEQQIADEVARILAFDNLSTQVPLSNAWMEALAAHLVRNRPASFVNVQLLDILKRVDRWGFEHPWTGLADSHLYLAGKGLLDDIQAAIAAADVVE